MQRRGPPRGPSVPGGITMPGRITPTPSFPTQWPTPAPTLAQSYQTQANQLQQWAQQLQADPTQLAPVMQNAHDSAVSLAAETGWLELQSQLNIPSWWDADNCK